MDTLKAVFTREPVMTMTALNAVLVLAIAFGLKISDVQLAAIVGATSSVIALWVRALVVPVVGLQALSNALNGKPPPGKDSGQAFHGTIWLIVAILVAICAIIFIVTHIQTKP